MPSLEMIDTRTHLDDIIDDQLAIRSEDYDLTRQDVADAVDAAWAALKAEVLRDPASFAMYLDGTDKLPGMQRAFEVSVKAADRRNSAQVRRAA